MDWISSAGGPLLLLGEEQLDNWGGHAELLSGVERQTAINQISISSDYDRACQVQGYLGEIPVGSGQGIVLGNEPMATAWKPFKAKPGGILVRWVFADSEARLLTVLEDIPDQLFQPDNLPVVVGDRKLFLFDSAVPGRSLRGKPHEFRPIKLDPGVYEFSTAYYNPDDQICLIVHRCGWWHL